MIILDKERFREALKAKGYRSVQELADSLGVHRNTIQYYLASRNLLPEPLEMALNRLELPFGEALVQRSDLEPQSTFPIARLIDRLHAEFPEVTFVLFGSRVQRRAHRYSDWDIGVFSREGLDHGTYLKIRRRAGDLADDMPYQVDIVNLNKVDTPFLENIRPGWKFLTGKLQDWEELQRRETHDAGARA